MKKLRLLGAAAIILLATYPAMATHAVRHCRHHQLGNPYTPEQDYMAWSAWRARGNWADSALSSSYPFTPASCERSIEASRIQEPRQVDRAG
jgi:hypothetical protein